MKINDRLMNKSNQIKKIKISLINTCKYKLPTNWFQLVKVLIKRSLEKRRIKIAGINLVVVDEKVIRKLNSEYRSRRYVTDVLSFTYDHQPLMGEIIICLPYAKKQARIEGVSVAQQLNRLVIHGTFHLLGFDHQTLKQWRQMNQLEQFILSNK